MFGGSVALGYHVYLCGRANLHGRIIGGGSCCLRLVVASAAGEKRKNHGGDQKQCGDTFH